MNRRMLAPRKLAAPLAAMVIGIALCSRALAQQPSIRPDALILVQPTGAQAIVTVSYSGKVRHQSVLDTFQRLAKLGGWKMTTPEVSDVELKSSAQFGPPAVLGVQTGGTAIISGAPLTANGGFILQPFVEAFRSLDSYKLYFWVPPQSDFLGLRHFESPELTVDLLQDGNPYRYSVVNHARQGSLPRLPLTQTQPSNVASTGPPNPANTGSAWRAVAPVVGISLACGALVFAALRLLAWYRERRNRGRNAARAGRTSSQESRHTSHI